MIEIIETNFKWNGSLTKRSNTDSIVLHNQGGEGTVESIHSYHQSKGWAGIGYHFFVRLDGKIYRGRPIDTVGAHADDSNSHSIGICAEGNYMQRQSMPDAQKQAIKDLLSYIKSEFYPNANVIGHNEVCSTDCPGKYYPLDELKDFCNNGKASDSGEKAKTLNNSFGTGIDIDINGKFTAEREGYYALVVNGENITSYAGNLAWNTSVDELAVTMTFDVPVTDMQYMNLYHPAVGDIVSLFTNCEIFRGIIVSAQNNNKVLSLNVVDFGWYLNKNKETYQFNGVSANDVISQICNDFQIPIDAVPELGINITAIYIDKTLSEILDDILERLSTNHTYDMTPRGLRIYEIGSIDAYPEFRISPNTELKRSMEYIGNGNRGYSIEDMKNSIKIVSSKDDVYTVEKRQRDDDSIYNYGMLQEIISIDPDKVDMDSELKNQWETLSKATETFSCDIVEAVDSYTRAGSKIKLYDEDYLIFSANHSIKNGIHYVSLELKRWDNSLLNRQQSSELADAGDNPSDNAWITEWEASTYGYANDDNGIAGWGSINYRNITGCHVAIPTYCIKQASNYNYDRMMKYFPEFKDGYGTLLEVRNPDNGKTVRAVVADCGSFGPENSYNHSAALDLPPNTFNALGLGHGTYKIHYRVVGKVDSWKGGQV